MDQTVCESATAANNGKVPTGPVVVQQQTSKKPAATETRIEDSVVEMVGNVMESISKMHLQKPYQESVFSAKAPPSISIKNYIKSTIWKHIGIFKYLYCSQPVVIVTLILLDRFQQRNPDLPLNDFCIHRVSLIAAVVAAKCTDDKFFSNSHYAKVGGIKLEQLNALEIAFLEHTCFDLFVSAEQYQSYSDKIDNYIT